MGVDGELITIPFDMYLDLVRDSSDAPHVEYGHRTINNGWVHGQRFLQANVDEQRMIYFMDLQKELREKIR